jgi:hypothetical protein
MALLKALSDTFQANNIAPVVFYVNIGMKQQIKEDSEAVSRSSFVIVSIIFFF